MRIGVTGHQARVGIDWDWVRGRISDALDQFQSASEALTSLAAGTDTVFAQVCIARSIDVTAVIPFEGYERFFDGQALKNYRKLLTSSKVVVLPGTENEQQDFLRASRYIVDHCDVLVAVWDDKPAAGLGGTADVVAYAGSCGRPLHLINPLAQTIRQIAGRDL